MSLLNTPVKHSQCFDLDLMAGWTSFGPENLKQSGLLNDQEEVWSILPTELIKTDIFIFLRCLMLAVLFRSAHNISVEERKPKIGSCFHHPEALVWICESALSCWNNIIGCSFRRHYVSMCLLVCVHPESLRTLLSRLQQQGQFSFLCPIKKNVSHLFQLVSAFPQSCTS